MDDARFVTAGGRIIFDQVTRLADGVFTHATHGLVTAVAKHTFHGGEADSDAAAGEASAWWEDEDAINSHVVAMSQAFPQFTYLPASGGGAPCWWGELDTGRGRFTIAILMRRDRGLPFVSVLGHRRLGAQSGRRWERSPHVYLNGDICVAGREDWHPDEHTAATATAWAAHWLAAYTEWRFTRRWPAEGVHAVAS